jgi:hypothetical protein
VGGARLSGTRAGDNLSMDEEAGAAVLIRAAMEAEGRRIVDEARAGGVTLRLAGGLAVRLHCAAMDFCTRDYSDLDMVGLHREIDDVIGLFGALGYVEEFDVRLATQSRQARFVRPCIHRDGGGPAHDGDHVDVFLDVISMDHRIDLAGRLTIEPYTIPVTELLLTKLQIHRFTDKDRQDVLTILSECETTEDDGRGAVNAVALAERCAKDWGLFYDVVFNLQVVGEALDGSGLSEAGKERVQAALTRLVDAIHTAPKSLAWRVRAKVGTKRRWYAVVEER